LSLPIKSRLTIWYVILLAVILAAWSIFLLTRLQSGLYASIDQALVSRTAQISLGLSGQGAGEFLDVNAPSLILKSKGEFAAQLLSLDGTVLESSSDAATIRPMISKSELALALTGHRILRTTLLGKDREKFRILAVKIPLQADSRVIVVGTSTESADNSIHRLLILLLISGPAALVAAGIGGWLLARKALLPVLQITSKAAEIGVNQLDERIETPVKTDELGTLAATLNSMLDRLQHGVEERRRFIADASHELRTPLAIMRSEIDISLGSEGLQSEAVETLESAREEVDRMSRIVENLLTLARIDEGKLQLLQKPVDIKGLSETVSYSMGFLAETKNISIQVTGDRTMVVADSEYLEQVITNLVENAVKYSHPGGSVLISTWQAGNEAGLTVQDSGPGIPAELLTRIFDRFFRVDTSRSRNEGGSGLGLSISREIIEAHNGRIWAMSDIGKGSTFSIALSGDSFSRQLQPSPFS
jgi:heavy metal sensor kinase